MNDTPNQTTSRMLMEQVDALAERPRRSMPKLGESAQKVHDAAQQNIAAIFEHAMARINSTRHGLDAMEAALVAKRNSLTDSLAAYVGTLEMIEQQTTQMQTAIGDAIVAQDGLA